MTRVEAIEWLKSLNYNDGEETQEVAEAINVAIWALEKSNEWILVSDRLPKDGERVWFTDNWDNVYETKFVSVPRGSYFGRLSVSRVKAWMPSNPPEPYKEEDIYD